MADHRWPPDPSAYYPWPRPHWRHEFWLTAIPFLLAFIVFFLPATASAELPVLLRFIIGLPLLLAPIIAPLVAWWWSVARMAISRIRGYPDLHRGAQQQDTDLLAIKADLYDVALSRQGAMALDLLRARVDDGHLYISIAKKTQAPLAVDDPVVVVDQTDGMIMGMFKVTQIRDADYYAVDTSGVNPLWKGQVFQQGEVSMFPNMIAVPLREGGQQ